VAEPRVYVSFQTSAGWRESAVVQAGGALNGEVLIQVPSDVNARAVLLEVSCNVHGRGTGEQVEALPEHRVYEGDLHAGQELRVPFEARISVAGPCTYQGRYIKMDWAVRVRLDVPLWFDKRYEFPFTVVPRVVARTS
jgi:hypothetical protein